jgi:hypothetical protein
MPIFVINSIPTMRLAALLLFLSASSSAQLSHQIGGGVYGASSKWKQRTDKSFIAVNPFLHYQLSYKIVYAGLGVGHWRNTWDTYWYFTDAGNDSLIGSAHYFENENSVFIPFTLGINPLNKTVKLGLHADLHYRYSTATRNEFTEQVGVANNISPADMDRNEMALLHRTPNDIAIGGGVHVGFEWERLTFTVQGGYLRDLTDVSSVGVDGGFTNLYVALGLTYRLNRAGSKVDRLNNP